MMNEEAAAIGCTGTIFTDPCGLEEGNVTTARDAYLILRALMEYDAYVEAAGTSTYQMPANTHHESPYTIIQASNAMLSKSSSYYREYTQGGKTGQPGGGLAELCQLAHTGRRDLHQRAAAQPGRSRCRSQPPQTRIARPAS